MLFRSVHAQLASYPGHMKKKVLNLFAWPGYEANAQMVHAGLSVLTGQQACTVFATQYYESSLKSEISTSIIIT